MNRTKIAKFSVVIMNCLVCIAGIILLIVGAVYQSQISRTKLTQTIGSYSIPSGAIISIIVGLISIFTGLLGTYAAVKEKPKHLYAYSIIMFLIFVIQLVTGSMGLSVHNNPNFGLNVSKAFAKDLSINSTELVKRDFYQSHFKCCGWNGVFDYINNQNILVAPVSCCISINDCIVNNVNKLYRVPCSKKIFPKIKQYIQVVGIILIVFSVISFVSIILSLVYGRYLKDSD